MEYWEPSGGTPATLVRKLIRAVVALHSTLTSEVWLWRGQADEVHNLEAGIHSRIRATGIELDERNALWATDQLIQRARRANLDQVEGLRLPDLALLAQLQHHGAATPLVDVTVDPFVALWMVVHSSQSNLLAEDGKTGLLYAIRRPPRERWLDPLDARPYVSKDDDSIGHLLSLAPLGLFWYRAPDVSERLRIQRGSFVVGSLVAPMGDGLCTLPMTIDPPAPWLAERINQFGQAGQPIKAKSDVVAFRIRPRLKGLIRDWLADRAGLTQEVIYPTPWHRPFLDQFCRTYGRGRAIEFLVG